MANTETENLNQITNNTPSVPTGLENAPSKDIVDYLFSNNNRLMTASGGELELPRDSQGLMAYFSDGQIIISRTHRYDGRVLAFLDLLAKQRRPMRAAFYSDLGLVAAIYKIYDERRGGAGRSRLDYDNQLQKDFVEIIAKAA
ncbi:MAG: hypothetical protein K2L94_02950, partial [Alphaproteobacteria bacterium]|nr:hypothetical protein [Alphaproteobacteria bacterium]